MQGVQMTRKIHVIETTRDLILGQGLQGASMAKIGKLSKVSIGSIYHMFASKEILINEVYRYSASQYLLLGQDVISFEGDTFKAAVFAALNEYIQKALDNPKDFLFVERHRYSPLITWQSKLNLEVLYSGLTIKEAAQANIIKDFPEALSRAMTYGIINNVLSAHLAGELCLDAESIRETIQATWDAIKK